MTGFACLSSTLLLSLFLSNVFAAPNVTVIPLGNKFCENWPGWMRSPPPDTTTPFQFQVVQAGESDANGLVSDVYTLHGSTSNLSTVSINVRKGRRFNNQQFQCRSGKLNLMYGGPKTILQDSISIVKDYRNAYLTFGIDGYKPEPYEIEIDGVRQPGVYLGARNSTTWGFNYRVPQACGELDFFSVRLLDIPLDTDNPGANRNPEFTGFLKIVSIP